MLKSELVQIAVQPGNGNLCWHLIGQRYNG